MRNVACKLCALHTPHIRAQGGHSGQLASLCFLRMWHPRTFRAQHACNTQHREKKRCLTSAGKMQRTQAWSPALQSTAANGVVQQRSLNKRPSTSFLWHGTPGRQQAVHLKGGGGGLAQGWTGCCRAAGRPQGSHAVSGQRLLRTGLPNLHSRVPLKRCEGAGEMSVQVRVSEPVEHHGG